MTGIANPDDPLAHLGARSQTFGDKAQRISDHFMRLTLLLVFADIACVITFLLAESHVIPLTVGETIAINWMWPGIATVIALAISCVCGLLKITDDLTR